jgi:hypothetical protein
LLPHLRGDVVKCEPRKRIEGTQHRHAETERGEFVLSGSGSGRAVVLRR